MPDTPALQDAFGQPTEQRPGCGFPVAHLLGLFHAGTGVLLKLVVAPLLTHDLAQVQAVHPSLQPGDVLVADRGLCSYAHLALLVQAGVHAVLRVGARQIVDFTPGRPFVRPSVRRTPAVKGIPRSRWLKALGVHDQLVAWLKPKTCPSWLTREALAALPESLVLREVRYHIGTPGLPDPPDHPGDHAPRRGGLPCGRPRRAVPPALAGGDLAGAAQDHDADGCAALQNRARRAEGIDGLRHRLQPGAHGHVANQPHSNTLAVERISFLDALRWLGAPSTGMPLGALIVNPIRPHRVEPRVKKRRPKSFPLMIKPRQALRQQLVQQELRG